MVDRHVTEEISFGEILLGSVLSTTIFLLYLFIAVILARWMKLPPWGTILLIYIIFFFIYWFLVWSYTHCDPTKSKDLKEFKKMGKLKRLKELIKYYKDEDEEEEEEKTEML